MDNGARIGNNPSHKRTRKWTRNPGEACLKYLGEFRTNLRPLLAASLGAGTSLPLFAYTNSAFAPHLVKQFGWSRSQFALVGLAMLTTLFVLPFIGRFTDRFGVRRVALVGTLLVPLCFVLYALQQGSFYYFVFCSVAVLAAGSLTSGLVYTRLIAENFHRAQGLALTVVNCVPALLAMAIVPVLNIGIETHGWRVSYLALGAFSLVAGLVAVMLIGKDRPGHVEADPGTPAPDFPVTPELHRPAREDYRTILSSSVFWIIFLGMFLCLLQTPLHASQMNIMLIDNQITPQQAAYAVSVYAAGTILGRIICGLALDRYPTPYVAALSMILPALGLFVLGTDHNSMEVISAAMFLVGLSVGAESDLITFLVARYFKLRIYNTTLGLVFCVSFLASSSGAVLISLTLARWNSFSPFLFAMSVAVALGSMLFLLLPKRADFEKIG
jgi:MFS family permease